MSDTKQDPITEAPILAEHVHDEEAHREIKRLKSDIIITRHVAVAAGAGLIPIPALDLAAVASVQATMLYYICEVYSVPFSKEAARSVILSLVGASIPAAESRSMLLAGGLKAIPVIGTIAGWLASPALAGASTYAIGKVFVQHLESGGTLLTFNAQRMKRHFEDALARGKKIIPGTGRSAAPVTA